MALDPQLITALGDELFSALRERRTLTPLTSRHPEISIDDAYRISLQFLSRREAMGERLIGKKIGVTSKAVQDMLGHESILTTEIYTHLDTEFLRQTVLQYHPSNQRR